MKVLRWIVLAVGFAIGGLLIGYPYLNEAVYTHTANTVIQSFLEQVEAEQEAVSDNTTAPPSTIYPELLEAMLVYALDYLASCHSQCSSPAAYAIAVLYNAPDEAASYWDRKVANDLYSDRRQWSVA